MFSEKSQEMRIASASASKEAAKRTLIQHSKTRIDSLLGSRLLLLACFGLLASGRAGLCGRWLPLLLGGLRALRLLAAARCQTQLARLVELDSHPRGCLAHQPVALHAA